MDTPLLSSFRQLGLLFLIGPALLLGAGSASAQVSVPAEPSSPSTAATITPRVQAAADEIQAQAARAFRGDDLTGKDGPMAPVGRDLATLYYQYEANGAAGVHRLFGDSQRAHQGATARYYSPVSQSGRFVAVHAIATETGSLWADLRALGLENGATAGNVVSGRLPISALKDAAALQSLRGMTPAYARTQVGSVGSEADTAHHAFEGRADLNVDGSGQKVCALSNSYDQDGTAPTTAQEDVKSGDLPGTDNPEGRTTPVDVLDDSQPNSDDEGRAMLQLIHDIAPGAELGFHTAFGGIAIFVQGIRDLADPNKGNCDILVDDVGYNLEPFYQDGPITNVADSVVDEGIPYFSSAGNDGQNSYEAPFRNSGNPGVLSPTALAHDFDPSNSASDTLQRITIRQGGKFRIFTLQWTDPSALVEGSAPADTDIDVALVNDTLGVVAQSARNSDADGNGIPVEGVVEHVNNGNIDANENGVADSTFHLVIEKAAGDDPDEVKYIYSGRNFEIEEYDTLGPTIYGHPMAENAMAVAAAPFYYTEAYYNSTGLPWLESFSSKGGIKIRFDQMGTPLAAPEEREKPDVAGTDGIDNTFFGGDIGFEDPDSHPNFFGTSAAAPNVAAIAALIQEKHPGFTPADTYTQLESSAKDVTRRADRNNNLQSISSGTDPWSGHGFVQANAAALPVELSHFDATLEGKSAVLTWTTSSETNNAGFEVAHKQHDGSFETIAYRDGGGTTSESRTYRYRTSALTPGTHTFQLRQRDRDGGTEVHGPVRVEVGMGARFLLKGPYPNPARAGEAATVRFASRQGERVRLALYDARGRRVQALYRGAPAAGQVQAVRIGGSGELASGTYFVRLRAENGSVTKTRALTLVR